MGPDGHPLVIPAWFLHRDGLIYVTPRARSTWLSHLLADPRTCFSVDEEPLPYRKVIVKGRAQILYLPGNDDEWRDIYRAIALRYWAGEQTDDYLDRTRYLERALIALPVDYDSPDVTTWRLPLEGEDPSGIWASRYWEKPKPEAVPAD